MAAKVLIPIFDTGYFVELSNVQFKLLEALRTKEALLAVQVRSQC